MMARRLNASAAPASGSSQSPSSSGPRWARVAPIASAAARSSSAGPPPGTTKPAKPHMSDRPAQRDQPRQPGGDRVAEERAAGEREQPERGQVVADRRAPVHGAERPEELHAERQPDEEADLAAPRPGRAPPRDE